MRKYTDRFVMDKLPRRLHHAACPFPGKYPLRLFVRVGETVLYHGKFHAAIWRQFFKNPSRRGLWYQIYDKAGPVLLGTNLATPSIVNGSLLYRYFASTWLGGTHLCKVFIQSVGPYRVYFNDFDADMLSMPVDRPRFIHHVNSNIAHIRTI